MSSRGIQSVRERWACHPRRASGSSVFMASERPIISSGRLLLRPGRQDKMRPLIDRARRPAAAVHQCRSIFHRAAVPGMRSPALADGAAEPTLSSNGQRLPEVRPTAPPMNGYPGRIARYPTAGHADRLNPTAAGLLQRPCRAREEGWIGIRRCWCDCPVDSAYMGITQDH